MRGTLFGSVTDEHIAMEGLTETAIFSQWFYVDGNDNDLHDVRWKKGEVDIVMLDTLLQKPKWGRALRVLLFKKQISYTK